MSAAGLARGVFIVSAKRTPFGAFGGKLQNVTATDLASLANIAALKAGNVALDKVDSVILGNVNQVSIIIMVLLEAWLVSRARVGGQEATPQFTKLFSCSLIC